MTSPIHSAAPTQITIHPAPEPSGSGGFFAGATASVGDMIDVINPLQHIPFVNTLYREMSGDKIGAGATLAGATLFGGVFGFFAGLANVIFEDATGKSVGDAVVTALRGETPDPNIQLASNEVNLGDFAGDARRNVCTRDCEAAGQEIAVAQAPTPAAEEVIAAAAPVKETTAQAVAAVATPTAPHVDVNQRAKDRELLALFGASPTAASAAYQKADMRSYLKEASTNLVM